MIFWSAKSRSKIEIFAEGCDLELSGPVIWAGSAAEAVLLESKNTAEVWVSVQHALTHRGSADLKATASAADPYKSC